LDLGPHSTVAQVGRPPALCTIVGGNGVRIPSTSSLAAMRSRRIRSAPGDTSRRPVAHGVEWRLHEKFGEVCWQFNNETDDGAGIRIGAKLVF